jgi:hypothetical protein
MLRTIGQPEPKSTATDASIEPAKERNLGVSRRKTEMPANTPPKPLTLSEWRDYLDWCENNGVMPDPALRPQLF